jgi:glycosyltransferase involved in cell wall biosynthesis
MKKLSIVIPAHNEEERIKKTLEDYGRFFGSLKKKNLIDFEINVILNACKDNTLDVVKAYQKKFYEIRFLNFEPAGKGFAVTEGFKDAIKRNADLIGFVDADGATPPEAFYDLVKTIKNYDGVIANRWDKKSIIKTKQTALRRAMSRVFNFMVRSLFLLPHNDTQCGAKLFKKELLEKIVPKLGSSEWSFDVDLLFYARREKAKIKSIPTIWEDQKKSRINLKRTPITMFLSVIRLRLIHSPLRFTVQLYRKLPERFKIHK